MEETIYVVEDEENDEEVKVSEKSITVGATYLLDVMSRTAAKMCPSMYTDYQPEIRDAFCQRLVLFRSISSGLWTPANIPCR